VYFTQLDRFQLSLGDHGIASSKEEKTMAAGAQMSNSEMFTEDQMDAWENKTMAQQTWAALQTYFTNKWLERKQYSVTTAVRLHSLQWGVHWSF
jgi:redox-sensitive bicupin YhaK (pirin superfamily)